MSYAFITGIPTAGKSFLGEKIAQKFGLEHVTVDDWRDELKNDREMGKWVDYFWNQDEKQYWRTKTCDNHWEDFLKQSEAFWPFFKKRIQSYIDNERPAIFEGVYLLPRFMDELNLEGVVLLGNSPEEVYERIKKFPRWGNTDELQRLEAKIFFYCKGPKYQEEAERFGYSAFHDLDIAEQKMINILQKKRMPASVRDLGGRRGAEYQDN